MRIPQIARSFLVVTLVCAPALSFAQAPKAAAAAKGRTIQLGAGDNMKYTVETIEAKPGEQITVVLKPTGTMPKIAMQHNFVLLKAGTDATAFANAAAGAAPTYIPDAQKAAVLASTKMAGNGETVEVSFKAPAKAGSYQYLCTFPGHFLSGMKGTLVVK
jgi:azurin